MSQLARLNKLIQGPVTEANRSGAACDTVGLLVRLLGLLLTTWDLQKPRLRNEEVCKWEKIRAFCRRQVASHKNVGKTTGLT